MRNRFQYKTVEFSGFDGEDRIESLSFLRVFANTGIPRRNQQPKAHKKIIQPPLRFGCILLESEKGLPLVAVEVVDNRELLWWAGAKRRLKQHCLPAQDCKDKSSTYVQRFLIRYLVQQLAKDQFVDDTINAGLSLSFENFGYINEQFGDSGTFRPQGLWQQGIDCLGKRCQLLIEPPSVPL